jgi:short-subunit dehydrogenase
MQLDHSQFGNWAVITGASSGIGERFASELATVGFNLVLVARRLGLIESLGERLSAQFNIDYQAIEADLSNPEDIRLLFERTEDIDVGLLISNAGTGDVAKFLDRNPEDLLARIQLNAVSHLVLTHHYGKKMAAKGRGGILLTGAMGAVGGVPYMATESATKGFIEAFGKSLHSELKEYGIKITVLVTTPTDTPVFYKLGFSLQNSPVKPISVKQCVAEALKALAKGKMLVYPGLKFRVMKAITPESVARGLAGKMLKKNNKIQ